MVWIVDYEDINTATYTTTVWDDKVGAYKDACACIVDDINNDWDFSDSDSFAAAKDIEKHISNQEYVEAVTRWNDWASLFDAGIYWNIHFEDVLDITDAGTPGTIAWPQAATVVPDPPETLPTGFVATTTGATCRGQCNQWNEYANADKADGTYLCTQCKTFQTIFGII